MDDPVLRTIDFIFAVAENAVALGWKAWVMSIGSFIIGYVIGKIPYYKWKSEAMDRGIKHRTRETPNEVKEKSRKWFFKMVAVTLGLFALMVGLAFVLTL